MVDGTARGDGRPLVAGDIVLLVDRKDRRYMFALRADGEFHTHSGVLAHTELIGLREGQTAKSTGASSFVVWRPTLSDYVLKMKRGAQIIYPKDIGPILMLADIGPGVRVLESGIGSGALSLAMLRAGADIVGYELREDFAERAVRNVTDFFGDVQDRYRVEIRSVYDGIDEVDLDAVVLDLPEPWLAVDHATVALRPGGILVGYTPSITQAVTLREALADRGFARAETLEVLNRTWHIDGQSVRPDHRMVAHTGFLTHARRSSS
ncbi:MAG: tRNA (adenine-N1)-methyltransferase [Acidimicrobiales bacterium]